MSSENARNVSWDARRNTATGFSIIAGGSMPVSKLHTRIRRSTALASVVIAALAFHQAAYADLGDEPARAAFGHWTSFAIPRGTSTVSVPLAQVPLGKRYVIELVSLTCTPGGAIPSAVLTVGQKNPTEADALSKQAFSIPFQDQGESLLGTLVARIYADDLTGSPSDVLLRVTNRDTSFPMSCAVSISGYLVSLEQ